MSLEFAKLAPALRPGAPDLKTKKRIPRSASRYALTSSPPGSKERVVGGVRSEDQKSSEGPRIEGDRLYGASGSPQRLFEWLGFKKDPALVWEALIQRSMIHGMQL